MQTKPFALSIGSKSALVLIPSMDEATFHLQSVPDADMIWAFRVFFQLRGDPLPPGDEAAWAKCSAYLQGLLQNRETICKTHAAQEITKTFTEQLIFTDENIDQVEMLVQGNESKLDPASYSDSSALIGILMFPLKDAAIYCGLVPEKLEPWRRYQRLVHKKQLEGR